MKMHHTIKRINTRYSHLISRTNRCSLEHRIARRWQAELLQAVTLGVADKVNAAEGNMWLVQFGVDSKAATH
jgi:hypothetical protein